jgi:hypothetical protein
MVRRPGLRARSPVYFAGFEAGNERWRQQKMVNPNAPVMFEGLPEVIPKGELPLLIRMQRPERIGVA